MVTDLRALGALWRSGLRHRRFHALPHPRWFYRTRYGVGLRGAASVRQCRRHFLLSHGSRSVSCVLVPAWVRLYSNSDLFPKRWLAEPLDGKNMALTGNHFTLFAIDGQTQALRSVSPEATTARAQIGKPTRHMASRRCGLAPHRARPHGYGAQARVSRAPGDR